MKPTISLGDFLRRKRRSEGITQDEMAKRIGVSRATVNRIENDRAFTEIEPILESYGVEIVGFNTGGVSEQIDKFREELAQLREQNYVNRA